MLPLGYPPGTTLAETSDEGSCVQGEREPVSKFPLAGTETLAQTVEVTTVGIDSVVVAIMVEVSVSVISLVAVCSTSTTLVAVTESVSVTETVLVAVVDTTIVVVVVLQVGRASMQLHAVWRTDLAWDSREERMDDTGLALLATVCNVVACNCQYCTRRLPS